uniref:Uncharacterized protein n=1 Tax=Maylandia zebra TaxID=106582 RepID=A0A3P9BML3_9CICH
ALTLLSDGGWSGPTDPPADDEGWSGPSDPPRRQRLGRSHGPSPQRRRMKADEADGGWSGPTDPPADDEGWCGPPDPPAEADEGWSGPSDAPAKADEAHQLQKAGAVPRILQRRQTKAEAVLGPSNCTGRRSKHSHLCSLCRDQVCPHATSSDTDLHL